jgi:membrane protease YdiL (CAAX protease family)
MRETEVPRAPWRPLDVSLAILTAVGGIAVLVAAVFLLTGEDDADSALALNSAVAITSGLLILSALIFGPLKHRVGIGSLGLRPPHTWGPSQVGLPLLVLTGMLIITVVYVQAAEAMGLQELEPPDLPFDEYSLTAKIITGALIIGIGPLAEEVFFRGFVFPGLANRFGVPMGMISSAALFSLAHGDVALFVPTFIAGILLAWLYLRTGSLVSPFIAHAAQNAIAFSVTIWG